jgi:hypothetical protein
MPRNLDRFCPQTCTFAPNIEQHNHWLFEKPLAARELLHAAVVNSGGSCDAVSPELTPARTGCSSHANSLSLLV